VVTGSVSANLEAIDFDHPSALDEWFEVLSSNYPSTADRVSKECVIVGTPSGGHHVLYRRQSTPPGNLKLAEAREPFEVAGKQKTTIIETRGEGGYVVAPPSDGYRVLSGRYGVIPTLTDVEVDALHKTARSFHQIIDESPAEKRTACGPIDHLRPGDDYNARGPGAIEMLTQRGWTVHGKTDRGTELVRPGKDPREGTSGEVFSDGFFRNYSTNADIRTGVNLSPFALYAELHHGGDAAAAAADLRSQGYGDAPNSHKTAPQSVSEAKPIPEPSSCLKIVTGGKGGLLEPPPQLRCLLRTRGIDTTAGYVEPQPFIERGKVAMLVGEGGSGKTFFAIQLAISVAHGRNAWDWDVVEQGRVLILSAEMTEDDMDRRFHNCLTACDIQGSARASVMSRIDRGPMHGQSSALIGNDGRETPLAKALERQVVDGDYALVILDPLASYGGTAIEANERNAVREFINYLNRLAGSPSKPTLLVLHHSNKAARGGVRTTAAAARGSSALTDAVRWQGNLEVKERYDGMPDLVVFRAVKANECALVQSRWLRRDVSTGALSLASRLDVDRWHDAAIQEKKRV
jgi:hypothetical protein